MKTLTRKNDWLSFITNHGWGNGYVVIPKGHHLNGMDYDTIHEKYGIDVHGGLTFSDCYDNSKEMFGLNSEDEGCWIVGFDTCHYNDNLSTWTEQAVQSEATRLMEQLKLIESEVSNG